MTNWMEIRKQGTMKNYKGEIEYDRASMNAFAIGLITGTVFTEFDVSTEKMVDEVRDILQALEIAKNENII